MINAFQEKMDAWIANIRDDWNERTSCQETMEVHLECEEAIPADVRPAKKRPPDTK
jgi:hypothetical protein